MKPGAFNYVRATSVDHLCSVLASRRDEAKILAGGQSLIAMMNLGLVSPGHLVDINGLSALNYVRLLEDSLCIGATARHQDVMDSATVAQVCPLIAQAYEHVAHRAIRNRGTLCGNLAHADPASEMPAVALALDAKMVLRSARNSRIVSADAFFLGLYSTVLEPDEFLEEVRFDPQSRNEGSAFVEVSARKGDFAFVGAAARIIMDKARCSMVRLVYSGIDGRPTRISQAEVAITGSSATLETFERAAAIASAIANPPSSFQAPSEYRKDLVRALTVQALLDASRRCREGE